MPWELYDIESSVTIDQSDNSRHNVWGNILSSMGSIFITTVPPP